MVLDAPDDLKDDLINIAKTCIENGVDRVEITPGYKRGWQIRFNSEWNEKNEKEILGSQKLFLAIIQLMEIQGFIYYGSVNLKGTSDTLFFVQSDQFIHNKFEANQTFTDNQYFAMIIDQKNFLRVINANPEVIEKIRKVTHDHWPLGSNMEANHDDYHEFRFNGDPWWSFGESSVTSRIFLTELFQVQ